MCECPIYCKYCGAMLRRDAMGYHYCPTRNCQWSLHGSGAGLDCDGKRRLGRGPFEGAQEKGRQAALAGRARTDCPYSDYRTYHGAVTFSRGFIRAWLRGYDAALAAGEYPADAACTRHLGEPWPCPKCAALAAGESEK